MKLSAQEQERLEGIRALIAEVPSSQLFVYGNTQPHISFNGNRNKPFRVEGLFIAKTFQTRDFADLDSLEEFIRAFEEARPKFFEGEIAAKIDREFCRDRRRFEVYLFIQPGEPCAFQICEPGAPRNGGHARIVDSISDLMILGRALAFLHDRRFPNLRFNSSIDDMRKWFGADNHTHRYGITKPRPEYKRNDDGTLIIEYCSCGNLFSEYVGTRYERKLDWVEYSPRYHSFASVPDAVNFINLIGPSSYRLVPMDGSQY